MEFQVSMSECVDRCFSPEECVFVHLLSNRGVMGVDDIAQFCQCCVHSCGVDRVGVWDDIVPPRYLILFDVWSDPVSDVSDFIHRFLSASVLPH